MNRRPSASQFARRIRWAPVAMLVALALVSSCRSPATEVHVVLGTDAPADRTLILRVQVRRGSLVDASVGDGGFHMWARGGTLGDITLPGDFTVVPAPGEAHDDAVTLVLDAELAASVGAQPITFRRVAHFRFTPGVSTRLPLYLSLRCAQPASGCVRPPATGCTMSSLCEEMMTTCGDDGSCVPLDVTPQPAGDGGGFDTSVPSDGTSDGAGDIVADIMPSCGHPGEPCCATDAGGGSCSGGSICGAANHCVACGSAGQPCCAASSCGAGEACDGTGTCRTCGDIGQLCCGGDACSAGICSSGTCTPCGASGQACCSGGSCGAGLICAGTCTPCGGALQPCCPGGACAATTVCSGGYCQPCGGNTQLCCAGGACNAGTVCGYTGVCHTCGYRGEPCCPGGACPGGSVRCYGSCSGVGSGGTCAAQCDHTSCCFP